MLIKYLKKLKYYIVKNDLISLGFLLLIVLAMLHFTKIGCPIRFITGFCCPGCGMTRAIISLLKLDIKSAFYYHPLVFSLPFILILMIYKHKINEKTYNIFLVLLILLFIIVYFIRLFNPNNDVVYINIKKSIIYKILNILKNK